MDKPSLSLEAMICKQKLSYFGHIMRADGLEKNVMLGKVEGSRRRGRPRTCWMDNVKDISHKNLKELKEIIYDRSRWRAFIHEVTRSRLRLDGQ